MVNIRCREDTGKLFFDFHFRNVRCREYTALDDTKANRKRMKSVADKITAEITLGTFVYANYFPNSKKVAEFEADEARCNASVDSDTPTFSAFVDIWKPEVEIGWRTSTRAGNESILDRYLLPKFGDTPVNQITKADVLAFRAEIAKRPGRSGNETLAPKTINLIIGFLTMILTEAADRYQFVNPVQNIKRLKNPRKDIEPFSLKEVRQILAHVRSDYRDYFTLRFFTGMRTGEMHGLKWSRVDWDARQILVRETIQQGRVEYTKTDGSQREIDMSTLVMDALKNQFARTGQQDYVFCTGDGTPLDTNNVTNRVWYPLLRYLELPARRPYNCRHTAATLWLASGENPEWIARQMGHTTTEMLFRVYSRYVPNLTRRDGSAFDNFVTSAMHGGIEGQLERDETPVPATQANPAEQEDHP